MKKLSLKQQLTQLVKIGQETENKPVVVPPEIDDGYGEDSEHRAFDAAVVSFIYSNGGDDFIPLSSDEQANFIRRILAGLKRLQTMEFYLRYRMRETLAERRRYERTTEQFAVRSEKADKHERPGKRSRRNK